MQKPRTVILGEKPQGTLWLQKVLDSGKFEVVAGVTRDKGKRWWGEDAFCDVLAAHRVPLVERSDLLQVEYDILLSFVYPFIIEPDYLQRAKWYAVNLHESPLPRYRGCNGYSHAILEHAATYGTSLHTMEAALDAGELIDQIVFPIHPQETAKELYIRTMDISTVLLERNLSVLASGTIPRRSIEIETQPLHTRSSLADLKRIPHGAETDLPAMLCRARALDFLPFEPAFFERDSIKYYVVVDASAGRRSYRDIVPLLDAVPDNRLPEIFLLRCDRPLVVMSEARYRSEYPIF